MVLKPLRLLFSMGREEGKNTHQGRRKKHPPMAVTFRLTTNEEQQKGPDRRRGLIAVLEAMVEYKDYDILFQFPAANAPSTCQASTKLRLDDSKSVSYTFLACLDEHQPEAAV